VEARGHSLRFELLIVSNARTMPRMNVLYRGNYILRRHFACQRSWAHSCGKAFATRELERVEPSVTASRGARLKFRPFCGAIGKANL
jgi:hypothetical protein